ncbi:MAG TPA: reverse transcriptase family protein [Bryobacteraceae bacterium]|nr:reverse transcriptase family protein [Bryobacteraceae bacterium]
MTPARSLLCALARSFLAGEQTAEAIAARAAVTAGRDWSGFLPLATRYLVAFAAGTRPREADVVCFLKEDRRLSRVRARLSVAQWISEPPRMQPVAAASGWGLPAIESIGALCDWLWLDPEKLDWFADLKGLCRRRAAQALQHYHYRALSKPDGGVRLIECPKRRLKSIQRQVLSEILDRVPAHPAAHGFARGRSIRSFARPHTARRVVLRLDLRNFFPSFQRPRIQAFFRTVGYPESVADYLGGLCTNAVPRGVLAGIASDARSIYKWPHLPQGAPTSPALANLCSYRMDCRLAGLAASAGAAYTRYADDLAFSGNGEFDRRVERFSAHAVAIMLEEGFDVNHRKTRIMRQGARQHLAGLTVNACLNVKRQDFDRLKAILTNCVHYGPKSQNRDAHPDFRSHLEGRVGFVESIHPARGKRLRMLLDRIPW